LPALTVYFQITFSQSYSKSMTAQIAPSSITLCHFLRSIGAGLLAVALLFAIGPTTLEAQRRSKLQVRQTTLFDQDRQIGKIYYPANELVL
jgi:hypothetical protein